MEHKLTELSDHVVPTSRGNGESYGTETGHGAHDTYRLLGATLEPRGRVCDDVTKDVTKK